jgi:hypothetical protein
MKSTRFGHGTKSPSPGQEHAKHGNIHRNIASEQKGIKQPIDPLNLMNPRNILPDGWGFVIVSRVEIESSASGHDDPKQSITLNGGCHVENR